MTTDALTAALAILSGPCDADGVSRSDDPRGMMVSADELANRRAIEGGNAPVMCGGCGYGLATADPICPKCGSGSREVATALVERKHLPDLLAGHKEAEARQTSQLAGHKSGLASAAAARKKQQAYYQANKVRILAGVRAYQRAHVAEYAAYRKAYRLTHKRRKVAE